MQIIFETPRLFLRQFTEADAPLIYRLNSTPEVLQYVHEPLVKSEDEAKEIISRIILPQYEKKLGRWAVFRKDNQEFIGWCGLKYLEETAETDLGYRFHPTAWGNGYATETAKHALAYGFNILQLPEIFGKVHTDNKASINVLKKIGMQFLTETIEDNCIIKVFHSLLPIQ